MTDYTPDSIPPPPVRKPRVLERKIERDVKAYARALGMVPLKFMSPAHRSVPDDIFCVPRFGWMFFVEFKQRGKKPTTEQARMLQMITKAGGSCFVVDSIEAGKQVIDAWNSPFVPSRNTLPGAVFLEDTSHRRRPDPDTYRLQDRDLDDGK